MKMLPISPGLVGTILQMSATIFLLAPKIVFIASCLLTMPFLIPAGILIEYLIVLVYNKIMTGSAKGMYLGIYFSIISPSQHPRINFNQKKRIF